MLFLICVAETFDIFVFPVISGAYYSTVYASGNPLPTNYIVAGTYNYITDTITINVPQNNSYYDEVMKHELCHRAQYQRNSSMSNYFREVECYIKERV